MIEGQNGAAPDRHQQQNGDQSEYEALIERHQHRHLHGAGAKPVQGLLAGLIAKAKAAGVYKGRPPSIEASRVRELKAQGMKGPRQVERLKAAGCTKVFSEKVSGKSTNGRHDKAIRALQPGDSTGWRGQFAIC